MGNELQAESKFDDDEEGLEQFKTLKFEYDRNKGRMDAQDMMSLFFVAKGEEKDDVAQEEVFTQLQEEYAEKMKEATESKRSDSDDLKLYRCTFPEARH
jgi:hypothetical protein